MMFVRDFLRLVDDWTGYAAKEVGSWTDTGHGGDPARLARL